MREGERQREKELRKRERVERGNEREKELRQRERES